MEDAIWPVAPMEPVAIPDPFDSADTLFQVKWDGVRILAYAYPDGVRLFNRHLHERTLQYPEITAALKNLPVHTVLDGEMIVAGKDGKPSFPRILRRDLARSGMQARNTAALEPVQYMVFDVLWYAGKNQTTQPLEKRLAILDTLEMQPGVAAVDSVWECGRALFEAVRKENLEGVVAKKSGSPYMIGKKTDLWKKIKCVRVAEALVGGYIQEGGIRSLLLGLEEKDRLRYIGAAAGGLSQRDRMKLQAVFRGTGAHCPFVNPPVDMRARWVLPQIKVRVRFFEYTERGMMRGPVITEFLEGLDETKRSI